MARPYRTVDDERDVFRALAHPVRRTIVNTALHAPVSFDALCRKTRRGPTSLAMHLRILREARLVRATRDGRAVRYQINRPTLRRSAKWLADVAG